MTTTDRARGRRHLGVTWSAGLLLSAAIGLVVALLRPESFWVVFVVFTACFLGPCIALAWLVLGAGRRVQPDPHVEENVESRWMDKAGSGALLDTVAAAGIAAGALSIFGWEADAGLVLVGVVAFALADGALRYALLARREA
jgi:hypothetical protein